MEMLGEVSSLDVSEERPDLLVAMSSQSGISTVSVSDVTRLRRLATRSFGETRFAGMRSSGALVVASDTGGSDTFLEGRSILDIGADAQLGKRDWHLLGAAFGSLAAILVRGHRYWITSGPLGAVQEFEVDGSTARSKPQESYAIWRSHPMNERSSFYESTILNGMLRRRRFSTFSTSVSLARSYSVRVLILGPGSANGLAKTCYSPSTDDSPM